MSIELELLRRFHRDGDSAAMEQLVEQTRTRLVKVAARIARGADVEDAVQGAYHALLRKGDLPDGSDVLAWLITTTVRIAYRRKALALRYGTAAERLALPSRDLAPGNALVAGERDELVRRAVHELPAHYRDAVLLHHLAELPVADVARLLEVPVSTVKTRVQRGRRLLRSRLSPALLVPALLPMWSVSDLTAQAGAILKGGLVMKGKLTAAGAALVFVLGVGTGGALGVVGTLAVAPAPADATHEAASQDATGPVSQAATEPAPDAQPSSARERVQPPPEDARPEAPANVGPAGGPELVTGDALARVTSTLRGVRRLALIHDLSFVVGPSGPTPPPDPARVDRFPDETVWPRVLGGIETDPARYRVVSAATPHSGAEERAAFVFPDALDGPVAAVRQQTLVFEEGIGLDGKVTLSGYGSVLCLGDMAGDVLCESYATVLIDGDASGSMRSNSYAQFVIQGRLTGEIVTDSYADIHVLGGFAGRLRLHDGAHVYLGGFVHSSDLGDIEADGRAHVLIERSDLGPGTHRSEKHDRLVFEVKGP